MYNGTHYTEIYETFLRKITDFNLLSFEEEDIEYYLEGYLKSAIANFPECKELEYRDNSIGRFKCDLSLIVKETLSYLMLTEWSSTKVHNITVMEQYLGDSEYKTFSQANHLDKLLAYKEYTSNEVERQKRQYENTLFDYRDLR